MASDNRPSAVDLIRAEAEARAPAYAFYRLVQMIQDALDDGREVGTHLRPAEERIIFEVDHSLGFPLSDVASMRLLNPACDGARADSPPCFVITVTFLGLHGSGSPLPSYYVEQIAGYDPKGSVLTDFFNFFHNRLIGLLHRGWRKYRYYMRYRPGGEDDFSRGIYSLFGLYDARLRSDSGIYWPRLLCFAGVLASRNRSPAVLSTIIQHTFRLERVSIEEWVRRRVPIPEHQKWGLGAANSRLGEGTISGDRAPDDQGKIRVVIHDLDDGRFRDFLPRGQEHRPLRNLVEFMLRDQFAYDFKLCLRPRATQPITLTRDDPGRLGWSSFLGDGRRDEERVVVITARA
ncbi:type VI secretion system baseplate subunit TssG [Methylobacterium sp. A49B]